MLKSFKLTVSATSLDEAKKEMDERTSEILGAIGSGGWECLEESRHQELSWIPGEGFYGETRGYEVSRHFVNASRME